MCSGYIGALSICMSACLVNKCTGTNEAYTVAVYILGNCMKEEYRGLNHFKGDI